MNYTDARAWAAGPDLVYRRLAAEAVAQIPCDLTGSLVLDAGAGTGAATLALNARDATVIAVDISVEMLRLVPAYRVAGDVRHLPLRTGCVDASVACLLLSHIDNPAKGMGELARVTKAGGSVTVTAFPSPASHPVKEAADRILAAAGYRAPDWYTTFKTVGEPQVGTPARLTALAETAGLHRPCVWLRHVSLDGLDQSALAAWRLGMAHVAAWLSTLDAQRQAALIQEVTTAVDVPAPPLPLLVMTCQRP